MDGSYFGDRSDTFARFDPGAEPAGKPLGLVAGLPILLVIIGLALTAIVVLGHSAPVIEGL